MKKGQNWNIFNTRICLQASAEMVWSGQMEQNKEKDKSKKMWNISNIFVWPQAFAEVVEGAECAAEAAAADRANHAEDEDGDERPEPGDNSTLAHRASQSFRKLTTDHLA